MKKSTTVVDYLSGLDDWVEEVTRLRDILVSIGLNETIKWGMPTYTAHCKNVVGLSCFKSHFGLWFFQGALLKDKNSVLINAQPGKTKAMRQWRMESRQDIRPQVIKRYVREAAELARQGVEIKADRAKPIVVPVELKAALALGPGAAFRKLSAGLRREYVEYIADAKRDATKQRRLAKILPMICAGVGLNDQYRR